MLTSDEHHREQRWLNISNTVTSQIGAALGISTKRVTIEDTFDDRGKVGISIAVLPVNMSRDLQNLKDVENLLPDSNSTSVISNASITSTISVNSSNNSAIFSNDSMALPNRSNVGPNELAGRSANSQESNDGYYRLARMDEIALRLRTMLANPYSPIYIGTGQGNESSRNWTSLIVFEDGFTLDFLGLCGNEICELGEDAQKCPEDCKGRQKFRPRVGVGFWQRDSDVFPCPDPNACIGASQCSNHTLGVMCARCAPGYTFGYFARCMQCTNTFGAFMLFLMAVALLVLMVIVPIHLFVQPSIKPSAKDMRRLSLYEIKQVAPVSGADSSIPLAPTEIPNFSSSKVYKAHLERSSVEELQRAVRVSAKDVCSRLMYRYTSLTVHQSTGGAE